MAVKSKSQKRTGWILLLLIILLIFVMGAALLFGSADMSVKEVIAGLFNQAERRYVLIVRNVRLPRLIAGFLAGIGLSVSGTLLQSVTQNKLAGPNIIGVNAGAGLMMVCILNFFPMVGKFLPIAAFLGAFLTTLLILFLANKLGSSKITVILSGMALTTIFSAAISFFCLINSDLASAYASFSVGSISQVRLENLLLPGIMILIAFLISLILSKRIDILCLGDSVASSLGVRVKLLRTSCLIASSLAASAVVSYAGLLGFVGLIVPHIARALVGERVFPCLLCGGMVGSILVILGDTIGRTMFAPTEVPVGIMMALIGSPFFLFLLFRRKYYV